MAIMSHKKPIEVRMPICDSMKKGEVYICEECGFEIKVVEECKECKLTEDTSSCCIEGCTFSCCGEELTKK